MSHEVEEVGLNTVEAKQARWRSAQKESSEEEAKAETTVATKETLSLGGHPTLPSKKGQLEGGNGSPPEGTFLQGRPKISLPLSRIFFFLSGGSNIVFNFFVIQ